MEKKDGQLARKMWKFIGRRDKASSKDSEKWCVGDRVIKTKQEKWKENPGHSKIKYGAI